MANVGTRQTSRFVEESDECQENVALEDTATAGRPNVQVGCVDDISSTNLSEESKPLSGTCTFSSPAPKGNRREVEAKSKLCGLQSALTPNLRILNISNKSPSGKPVKYGMSPCLNRPCFPLNQSIACQKPATSSGLSDLSPSHIGGSLGDRNASLCWWYNETMPEVSLLDDTCDSTMQSSWAPPSTDPNANVVNTPAGVNAPRCWLDGRFSPDITLLEVTQDSELSPVGNICSAETTQGNYSKINTPSVKVGGENVMQLRELDINRSEEFSLSANSTATITSLSLQQSTDVCAGEKVVKVSAAQDVSMESENSRSSTGLSEQDEMSQTSTEDKLGIHPANVTRDISSSDVSAASQLSTTDMQVTTSSTFELHGEPAGAENENLPTSCDTEMTSKVQQRKSEIVESDSNTFTVSQSSINGTTNVNTTTDMAQSLNNRDAANDTQEQDNLATNNATENPLNIDQNSSADKSGSSCDVKNGTFDQHSVQTSRESIGLQETGLQNNTFDMKSSSKRNTMTLSEITLGDVHQDTLDKSSPSKVCSTTTSSKDCNSEVHATEPTNADWTSKVKKADLRDRTFESSLVVKTASEAEHPESNDQPDLPLTDCPSDGLGHHSISMKNSKENDFNLDDTLDIRMDYLVTSTPMANCKINSLCNEQDNGQIVRALKKNDLYCPSKHALQVPSAIPSNIVCERKTFFRQPAAASSLPPFKAASHLKPKPASTEGRGRGLAPSVTGLAMTRSRTLALKNTSAPDPAQGVSGTARSYSLRAATAGSKHPPSGLLRPQTTGIPSCTLSSLRPLLTRSTIPASSTNDKICGPTASNPLVKHPQTKKHQLNRLESLPTSKRKKMDAAVAVKIAEASASCDAAGKARVLKPPATIHRVLLPKPPAHGCAKCIEQEEEIKNLKEGRAKLEEEIHKLKEELKKCKP
ncbi:uncharacterized protein LOC114845926 [Betta splendens]|uniref:Uncharacterized protein LOC114845926 n=1 Tax=Betta splendens TaxID=158456 RepID=A0A6P7L6U9_BETSP|nr:uncharacterized protein LOC114845926 [Betta splendens]XP_028990357.1 uncharacterized protein LOC114845926 [Betta splendens]